MRIEQTPVPAAQHCPYGSSEVSPSCHRRSTYLMTGGTSIAVVYVETHEHAQWSGALVISGQQQVQCKHTLWCCFGPFYQRLTVYVCACYIVKERDLQSLRHPNLSVLQAVVTSIDTYNRVSTNNNRSSCRAQLSWLRCACLIHLSLMRANGCCFTRNICTAAH